MNRKGLLFRWLRARLNPKVESHRDVLRITIGTTIMILSAIAVGEMIVSRLTGSNLWADLSRGMVFGTLIAVPAVLFNSVVLRENVILSGKFRRAYRLASRNAEQVLTKNQELEEAQQRLAELAHSDFLTGLANRRRFEQAFADAFGAVGLGGPPFSLILLDLDNFKQINDGYGHDAGDAALGRGWAHVSAATSSPFFSGIRMMRVRSRALPTSCVMTLPYRTPIMARRSMLPPASVSA